MGLEEKSRDLMKKFYQRSYRLWSIHGDVFGLEPDTAAEMMRLAKENYRNRNPIGLRQFHLSYLQDQQNFDLERPSIVSSSFSTAPTEIQRKVWNILNEMKSLSIKWTWLPPEPKPEPEPEPETEPPIDRFYFL